MRDLTVTSFSKRLILTINNRLLLLLLWPEVELFGEHGGEAGHLLLPDNLKIGARPDTSHGHFPVDQSQQLCEFQGVSVCLEEAA